MLRHHLVATLLSVAVLTAPSPLTAGATQPAAFPPDVGILVMAHGGDPEWNRDVGGVLTDLRARVPLALAFGMADRSTLQAGIDSLAARGVRRVAVVRLFLSGRSFEAQTRYLLGLDDHPPEAFMHHGDARGPNPSTPPPVDLHGVDVLTHQDGLMDWPGIGSILLDRVRAVSPEPTGRGILVIGHGMGDETDNEAVLASMQRAVDAVRQAGYGPLTVATLREDWPQARARAETRLRNWIEVHSDEGPPLVVPFRLSGFGPYASVLDGLAYRPAGGLLPDPSIGTWVEETALHLLQTTDGASLGHENPFRPVGRP